MKSYRQHFRLDGNGQYQVGIIYYSTMDGCRGGIPCAECRILVVGNDEGVPCDVFRGTADVFVDGIVA